MKICLLGTGGYHPNERRHTACLLLPELGVLLDAGTSVFRVMSHHPGRRLQVFLTHAHLDHVAGLTYLLAPMVLGELERVAVHAAPAALEAVRTHLFAPALFPVLPAFEFHELDARPQSTPVQLAHGARLTACSLASHPGGSLAYRVDWTDAATGAGKSVAYVTDTCVDGSYTEFIRGCSVLIHECYFADDDADWAKKTGHSALSEVTALARSAGVARLILTHIDPRRDVADPFGAAALSGEGLQVETAVDGLVLDV